MVVETYTFYFVKQQMLLLSMPPLTSNDLRERAMVSAVSNIMIVDCAGTRKKEKLDGLSMRYQNRTHVWMALVIPAGI